MEQKLASIIIPVYKVEKYLEDCVNSIISNSGEHLNKLEIILVDDGSPDNCPKICDDLAKKHSQIKVVHKTNGGLSSARNSGVKEADGEYLIFVDSDDSVNEKFKDMLRFISENNYDVIECGCRYIQEDKTQDWTNQELNTKEATFQDKIKIFNNKLQATAWSKVVKRDLFINKNLFFREGFVHEDEHYMPRLIVCANSIYITNDLIWYNYFVRGGSITSNYSIKNAKHVLDNMQDLLNNLAKNIQNIQLQKALKKHLVRTASGVLLRANLIKKEDKKEYYKLLKQYKNLFTKGYCFKQKLISMSIKLLGFKFTTILLKLI